MLVLNFLWKVKVFNIFEKKKKTLKIQDFPSIIKIVKINFLCITRNTCIKMRF